MLPDLSWIMDAKIGTLTRDEVSVESQWDLTGLYSSDVDWNAELTELEAEKKKYASFKDGRWG